MHNIHRFFFLIVINLSESFFLNSPLDLNTIKPRQNLTCASEYSESDSLTNCEYCVYEFFNNGTDSIISQDCIYLTNSYRLVTKRCTGFTDSSDIGYGVCTQLPFEYFDIDLLCICATDFCNENFTTCKQSVDLNPNLPALPSPVPLLTTESSKISCQDSPLGLLNTTYYCFRDSTPYIDQTQCEEYVRNHTVLCMYIEADNGSYLTIVAIPDEDYEYVLTNQIQLMEEMSVKSNVQQYYNETTSTFYIQWKEILENQENYTMIYNKCYCMTNDCNTNLTTCLQSFKEINLANRSEIKEILYIFSKCIF